MIERTITLLCLAALVAGCAGGTQGASPLPSGDAPALAKNAGKKGHLVLRIRVPHSKAHPGRRWIHHHYISLATQSIAIAIAGPTNLNETVNLTPNSTGCSSTIASTLCVLSLPLSAGSGYTATMTTYDGLNGAGKVLSTAQAVPFTVVAGTSNTINMTLSGVPVQLVVLPLSATAGTNANGGIDLMGTAPSTLMAEALDADGNVILGIGAPTFSVFKNGGQLGINLTQPAAANGNTFTVTPQAAFSPNTATIEVDAGFTGQPTDGCAQAGAVCTTKVTLDMLQSLAVMDANGFELYPLGSTTPYAAITKNVPAGGAKAIAADVAGNIYVAVCGAGCGLSGSDSILIYSAPYTGTPVAITTGVTDPLAIGFDGLGNLFVANCAHSCNVNDASPDTVAKYSPPFTSGSSPAVFLDNTAGILEPDALAFDSSNDLFVANVTGNGGVGSVTEYGAGFATNAAPAVTITASVAAPNALLLDSANDLFVSDTVSGCSNASTTPTVSAYPAGNYGTNAPTTFGTTNVKCPNALAYDSASNRVWVSNSAAGGLNNVNEFSNILGGGNLRNTLTTSVNAPVALLEDSAHNVYVASNAANVATSYNRNLGFTLQATYAGVTTPTAMAIVP